MFTFKRPHFMAEGDSMVIHAKTTREMEEWAAMYDDTVSSLLIRDFARGCFVDHDKGKILPQFKNR